MQWSPSRAHELLQDERRDANSPNPHPTPAARADVSLRARRLGAAFAVTAVAALAAPLGASAASTYTEHVATLARQGIAHAVKAGWVKAADAKRYRADVYLALRGIRFLPKLRGQALAVQLDEMSTLWDSYTAPRALALFSQLQENVSYLTTHRLPTTETDVEGSDGVVYRYFPGKGLEFHPLANFARLNGLVASKDAAGTQQLADALVARAIPRGNRLLWEYAFGYGRGRPPWSSGMAQAVAAQSLARAGVLLADDALLTAARKAYASVPPLTFDVSTGPWIRLYGFDREIVLNAQLQTALSLRAYGGVAGDPSATALADRMTAAARGLFWRFDTGDWSRYELGGGYAKRGYQIFVTTLLGKLASVTQDPFWQDAAARFTNYTYEPPQVTQPDPPPALVAYPQPLDGWLDSVSIPLTLSKRASVTLVVAGKVFTWSQLARGDHTLTWKPGPDVAPGTYPVTVRAVDFGGNKSTTRLAPVTVAWDTAPPPLEAQVDTATNTLTWQANDPGTPWLELKLELTDPTGAQAQQIVDLGQQPTSGTLQLSIPPGTWYSAIDATNSAGQTTKVLLPALSGAAAPSPSSSPQGGSTGG